MQLTIWLRVFFSLFGVILITIAEEEFPTCGDCWCVPGNNGLDTCPYDEKPQTVFSDSTIQTYLHQTVLNPYTLDCNPYRNKTCETTPPQKYLKLDTAVCAFVYTQVSTKESFGDSSCSSYSLQSFPTRTAAENAGATITHEGSCGLCSTTIDLAIYLSKFLS
jgi:hypothetical protein